MSKKILIAAVIAAALSTPAFAQDGSRGGAAGGAAAGAVGGALVGGPVGAVVGGAAGAIAGGAVGSLSNQDQAYVDGYVVKHRHPSVKVQGDVAVGAVLPRNVVVYPIEGRPEMKNYRYAWVNDRAVLIDPASRRVVYVVD